MKKFLVSTVLTLATSLAAQAEIVKPNVYQKTFSIEKSARFISVVGLKIKKVPSLLDVVPNPDYQVMEDAASTITTILEKVEVVQASLRYEHSDAGEIEGGDISANFKLTDFTEEELAILESNNIFKKYKLMKSKVTYSIKEEVRNYSETYCAEPGFDDYNRPMSECRQLATRPSQSRTNKITISLK